MFEAQSSFLNAHDNSTLFKYSNAIISWSACSSNCTRATYEAFANFLLSSLCVLDFIFSYIKLIGYELTFAPSNESTTISQAA